MDSYLKMASIFPPRCFTCGKVITWSPYENKVSTGIHPDSALDELGYRRMCCRRMFKGHVPELEEDMLLYTRQPSGNPMIVKKKS